MMNKKAIYRLLTMIVVFSFACNFATGLIGGNGPEKFTAKLVAPDIIQLNWESVQDASGYLLEVSLAGDEFFEVAKFAADRTTYTDYLVPEQTEINYRLTVLNESGEGGTSQTNIATGERKPNPLSVTPVVDETLKVSQTIGVDGGSLTLVDSAGVEYTLEVPAGAVDADTTFSLTPVLNLDGWPLDEGILAGVKVEPEDLLMAEPATLTISLLDLPTDERLTTVGFSSLGSGEDFYLLQPVVLEEPSISLQQNNSAHLAAPSIQGSKPKPFEVTNPGGITGVGQGSKESIAKYSNKHSPNSKTGARSQKEVQADTLEPLPEDLNSSPLNYELAGIGSDILTAADCRQVRSQILAFGMWRLKADRSKQPVSHRESLEQKIWDKLVDKTKEILDKAAEDCEKNKDKSDAVSVNCAKFIAKQLSGPKRPGFWNLFRDQMENSQGKNYAKDISEKLEKCKKASYLIVGGLDDWQTETAVCDIMQPFTLTGNGIYMEVSGGLSGTYTYIGPFNAHDVGIQTYTISLPDGVGKPGTMTGGGTGAAGEETEGGTENYTLTPIDPATTPCTQK